MNNYLVTFLCLSFTVPLLAPPPEGAQQPKAPTALPYRGPIMPVIAKKSCQALLRDAEEYSESIRNQYDNLSHYYEILTEDYRALVDESAQRLADINFLKNEVFTLFGTLLRTEINIQKATPEEFADTMRINLKALLNYMDIEYEHDTPKDAIRLIRKSWDTLKQRCLRLEKESAECEVLSESE